MLIFLDFYLFDLRHFCGSHLYFFFFGIAFVIGHRVIFFIAAEVFERGKFPEGSSKISAHFQTVFSVIQEKHYATVCLKGKHCSVSTYICDDTFVLLS